MDLSPDFPSYVGIEQGAAAPQPAVQSIGELDPVQPGEIQITQNFPKGKFLPGLAVVKRRENPPRRKAVVGAGFPGNHPGVPIGQKGKVLNGQREGEGMPG